MIVVAAAACALACAAAQPAAARPLRAMPSPLPGSRFQGGDGNQISENGLIDWDAVTAVHNSDPNAHDSRFAGGTKEGDPNHWQLESEAGGVTPGKANVVDAWSAVDQPQGHTFLYLAYARAAGAGATFVTFELNRDSRLWTNAVGEQVPCRREGDILVSYELSNDAPGTSLWRWHTLTTDPGTGCAMTGEVEPLATAGVAQGAVNAAAIANPLGGFFGASIPARQFAEAALDLDALLGPVFHRGCFAFGSIWMHSRSSTSYDSQMQDYVAPRAVDLRTCAAEGTKFFDLDADGVRDANEPGIPGFQIWADYNGNGVLDTGEPWTVSDSRGRYVLDDIRPPHGNGYTLRERLLPIRRRMADDWRCSFPNDATDGGFGPIGSGLHCGWGPIDPVAEPNAQGRDFGNWYPAQLTVRKKLYPPDDTGRFDLLVDGDVVFSGAQDGSSVTLDVPPGVYTISEQPVPPADASQYHSRVDCKTLTRRARVQDGESFATLPLAAGGRATCTVRNARIGAPAIAIDKTGPAIAHAGDTLHYTLVVTNPGDVPFAAADVHVTDPACDDPPRRTGTGGDATPGILDPGDTWTYACSRDTAEPGDDCVLRVVTNTATVTGGAGGSTVEDSSTIGTTLLCPDKPKPPDPPDPTDPPVPPDPNPPIPPQPEPVPPLTPVVPGQPDRPGAVRPPLPRPPAAGQAGVAGVSSSRLARCVAALPRVRLHGSRMGRIRVSVDGRLVRVLHPTPLQRRAVVSRLGKAAPGRHRITVRVRFDLGSGTPPLTLVRRVRICRAVLPLFTG